jgi:hypothetical protein
VDKPYEMQGLHHEDLSWSKDEPSFLYCISIQGWIEQACRCTCQSWHNFVTLVLSHVLDSMFSHEVMFVLAHDHFLLDKSLFWFITKHKGRIFYLDKMLGWLHWLCDCIEHFFVKKVRVG